MNSNSIVSLLPIILIVLVFYLFIIRPNQNRQRAAAQMRNELAPGAQVKTIGGLFATVSTVEDDVVVLEGSPGVYFRYDKRAIAQVITPAAGQASADTPEAAAMAPDQPTAAPAEPRDAAEPEAGDAKAGEGKAGDGKADGGDAEGTSKPKSE